MIYDPQKGKAEIYGQRSGSRMKDHDLDYNEAKCCNKSSNQGSNCSYLNIKYCILTVGSTSSIVSQCLYSSQEVVSVKHLPSVYIQVIRKLNKTMKILWSLIRFKCPLGIHYKVLRPSVMNARWYFFVRFRPAYYHPQEIEAITIG